VVANGPCVPLGSARSDHPSGRWVRVSEAEERDLAAAFLEAFRKQVEGDPENDIAPQALETERPHPFVPSQVERHAQFTETGRMPFWVWECPGCGDRLMTTPHDPGLGPLHPHAQTVR
jgi:hypothetical protein